MEQSSLSRCNVPRLDLTELRYAFKISVRNKNYSTRIRNRMKTIASEFITITQPDGPAVPSVGSLHVPKSTDQRIQAVIDLVLGLELVG
jgi:hypothetical protein